MQIHKVQEIFFKKLWTPSLKQILLWIKHIMSIQEFIQEREQEAWEGGCHENGFSITNDIMISYLSCPVDTRPKLFRKVRFILFQWQSLWPYPCIAVSQWTSNPVFLHVENPLPVQTHIMPALCLRLGQHTGEDPLRVWKGKKTPKNTSLTNYLKANNKWVLFVTVWEKNEQVPAETDWQAESGGNVVELINLLHKSIA